MNPRELQKTSVNGVCKSWMRAWKPFLSRHVRGSLHKRACEQDDPFAPDVMLNVCSQFAVAWVGYPFSISAGILRYTMRSVRLLHEKYGDRASMFIRASGKK